MKTTAAEIQKEIDEYEDLLKSNAPQDEKDFAKKEIAKLKAQLANAKPDAEPVKKNKPAKVKKAKKPRDRSKEKKINPRLAKLTIEIEGKKVALTEASCWDVMKNVADRLERAKKAQGKYKTKPVVEKVGDSLEHSASHAVDAVSKNRIETHPNQVIAGAKMVEAAFEKMFEGFEKMSGKKIPAETRKKIRELLEEIKDSAEDAK